MRNREHGAVFRQSLLDFPCPVRLGESSPSFGLHRFRQGLRFIPTDDEGFTLQGDKQRLVFKGRRRSHRFTILGDTAFEYDCILNKEPDSNIIRLRIEGAENFDFFRQPDFVKNPFLKGSFAVYKKETLIGEGTGKLCHIHRPEIIDARGRRCWGSLAVIGNELQITIPEKWLSEASYPVVVDPTVGTTTVGSQEPWPGNGYDASILYGTNVNKYLLSDTAYGDCTAYFYCYWKSGYGDNIMPVLFNDLNGKPNQRRSQNENEVSTFVSMNVTLWRTATFKIINSFQANTYIWFGGTSDGCVATRFDYGGNFYTTAYDLTPNFPINGKEKACDYKISWYFTYVLPQNYTCKLTQGVNLTDIRKSKAEYMRSAAQTMKITTTLSKVQKFIRQCLITVGNTMRIDRIRGFLRSVIDMAGLFEEVKHKWEINRKCAETVEIELHNKQRQDFSREITDNDNASDYRKLTADYMREIYQTVQGITKGNTFVSFLRQCVMKAGSSTRIQKIQQFFRSVFDWKEIQEDLQNRREIARRCKDNAEIIGEVNRSKGFFREIIDNLTGTDNNDFNILFVRSVNETQGITDSIQKWSDYIRGLYIEAGSIEEIRHEAEYYRLNKDTLQAAGSALRSLGVIIRIVSRVLFRDYLLSRFLKAKTELVLKSCVVREIHLESRIN